MEPDEADILEGCRAGDRAAWTALVDRYGARILKALQARLRGTDPGALDECFQGFWVRLMSGDRLKGVDPGRPLGPYLVAAALNFSRSHLAREARRRGTPLQDLPDPGRDPAEAAGLADTQDRVKRVLQELSPRDRLLLTLVDVDGLPHERVARALGVTTHSVATLLGRARERLKSRWEGKS